ncbi:MAG: DNA ligase-associated DEXH box helicase, partial [Bacteroidota bacterium]
SAQVKVEYKGEIWVASGDYKVSKDPVAEDFEPVCCHTFITECTFGLPVFNWPDATEVMHSIHEWWRSNQKEGKASILSAYSLGKAQRVLEELDSGIGEIFVHGAVDGINKLHREAGFLDKKITYLNSDIPKEAMAGSMVVAPPGAVGSSWTNRMKPYSVGIASGWMMLRGSKRRQNADRGFVISDHADWNELNTAIKATGAENIICTHGYTDSFAEWLNYNGYNATSEKTLFEGEALDSKAENE